jgi:hypothetical protein
VNGGHEATMIDSTGTEDPAGLPTCHVRRAALLVSPGGPWRARRRFHKRAGCQRDGERIAIPSGSEGTRRRRASSFHRSRYLIRHFGTRPDDETLAFLSVFFQIYYSSFGSFFFWIKAPHPYHRLDPYLLAPR